MDSNRIDMCAFMCDAYEKFCYGLNDEVDYKSCRDLIKKFIKNGVHVSSYHNFAVNYACYNNDIETVLFILR